MKRMFSFSTPPKAGFFVASNFKFANAVFNNQFYSMKGGQVAIVVAVAIGLILLSTKTANAGPVDLSSLNDQFGSDRVQRLQNVQNVLSANGLSDLQIKLLLAQILQETGLFTNVWNQNATDNLNNYAGISSNGNLKSYPNIQAFVADYLRVLNLPNAYPIDAVSVSDFNTRLKMNGYYTDSATTYGNNLNYYFNILG